MSRNRPLEGEVRTIRHFDERFTALWERIGERFSFAVRRDAAYLNWKYIQAPRVRYLIAVLERDGDAAGYVVYRHRQEPRDRVTLLVDFLADPADTTGSLTLLRWVDREARAADSDKIRTFAMHDGTAGETADLVGGRHVTLFVNLLGTGSGPNPPAPGKEGMTFAIWGPWSRGLL